MEGMQVEAVSENGVLKLSGPLPLAEGRKVTITIHPTESAVDRLYGLVPWPGNREEFDRWLNDPDEGLYAPRDPLDP
jgi:predicted DNA-binding antitoxin AbrB/MazE fold protein